MLNKETFVNFLKERKLADEIDFENLYELYDLVTETISEILAQTNNPFNVYVNHYVVCW